VACLVHAQDAVHAFDHAAGPHGLAQHLGHATVACRLIRRQVLANHPLDCFPSWVAISVPACRRLERAAQAEALATVNRRTFTLDRFVRPGWLLNPNNSRVKMLQALVAATAGPFQCLSVQYAESAPVVGNQASGLQCRGHG
jgi:hypothetical protein